MGAIATLLLDGRVLIAGGSGGDTPVATLDIFDPVAKVLNPAGAELQQARRSHAAALTGDGRVLAAGGTAGDTELDTAETLDPSAQA